MACLPLCRDFFLLPDVLEQSLHHPCWCCRVCIGDLRGKCCLVRELFQLWFSCFYVWWMFSWLSCQEATEVLFPAFQLIHWFGVSVPPSSRPRTCVSEMDLLPDSFLVISYSVLVLFLVAASFALDASWSILLFLSWRVLLLTSFCCSVFSFWAACFCALVLAWRSGLLMVLRSSIFAMVSLRMLHDMMF